MRLLLQANALHIPLAAGVVQMAATSPPYWGLRKYDGDQAFDWPAVSYAPMAGLPPVEIPAMRCELGLEPTPLAYIGHLVAVFREARRVMRDDGVLWLNLGDTYTQDTKWGGQSNHMNYTSVKGGHQDVRNNRTDSGLPDKNLAGIPWRAALALQADGWVLRSDVIWHKPNGMPQSVKDRPTTAHEYVFLLAKSKQYYYDLEAIREPLAESSRGRARRYVRAHDKHGGPERPTSKHKREGIDQTQAWAGFASGRSRNAYNPAGRNKRTIWKCSTASFKGSHFAVWPMALVEPMIKAGSRVGDLVLDPFNGAGTTGVVAGNLGRRYVGLDVGYTYLHDIAAPRLSTEFGTVAPATSEPLTDLPMFADIESEGVA